jgi:hypothetical protein
MTVGCKFIDDQEQLKWKEKDILDRSKSYFQKLIIVVFKAETEVISWRGEKPGNERG